MQATAKNFVINAFLDASEKIPHAEERALEGASRSTYYADAARLGRSFPAAPISAEPMSAYLYILRCSDGSYYVGTTRDSLEPRIAKHQAGTWDGYTPHRRPVTLVFHQHFQRIEDALSAERQIKGWRREKKEALIGGDNEVLPWPDEGRSRVLYHGRCVLRDAALVLRSRRRQRLEGGRSSGLGPLVVPVYLMLRSARRARLEARTTSQSE
jgi:putative endonuclease